MTAPKDGEKVWLHMELRVPAFWCSDLERWVLDRQYTLDSFRADHDGIRVEPRNEPWLDQPLTG